MDLTPPTLTGKFVTLEPIDERHAPDLFAAMQDEEVCRYLAWPPPVKVEETVALIREARELMARGQSIVLAQIWNATGHAIGSTRLLDLRPADRQVEIGSTFLARDYWRTPANTESKLLFLSYCFEKLGCVRVALKTDGRNVRSQEAIARLGAVREGVLRKHMNVRGYQRDTVYFSILAEEWPAVRGRLQARLAGGALTSGR
ncbi:MAG: GNAT family N-acetyltransferase [Candidatus Rokuibacteriota bacterium]|nr:MAG: GNAT family N-acetyltransferase [Candidatus Rokubacteria bacterium]